MGIWSLGVHVPMGGGEAPPSPTLSTSWGTLGKGHLDKGTLFPSSQRAPHKSLNTTPAPEGRDSLPKVKPPARDPGGPQ